MDEGACEQTTRRRSERGGISGGGFGRDEAVMEDAREGWVVGDGGLGVDVDVV